MRFDINSYETVASRIDRLLTEWPDARIVTEDLTTDKDRETLIWRVKAYVYLTAGDQAEGLPKATGHAFEIDGQKGANVTSAYENCETSAIGRAVSHALTGYSGDKKASREEMQKVERGESPRARVRNWITEASTLKTVDDLRSLWMEAKQAKAPQKTLDMIQELADVKRDTDGELPGTEGSSTASDEKELL